MEMYDNLDMNGEVIEDQTDDQVTIQDDLYMSNYDIIEPYEISGGSGVNIVLDTGDALYVYLPSGERSYFRRDMYVDDDFDCGGTKDAVIAGTDGHFYNWATVESSELWLEERFSDTLSGSGTKDIDLDDRFIACTLIDGTHAMHVVATPTSTTTTPIWVEKKSGSVTVHGGANVTFDLIISAKRIDTADKKYDETLFDEETGKVYKSYKSAYFSDNKDIILDMQYIKARMRLAKEMEDMVYYQTLRAELKIKQESLTEYVNPNQITNKTFYYIGAVAIQPTPSNTVEYPGFTEYSGSIEILITPSSESIKEHNYNGSVSFEVIPYGVNELIEVVFPYAGLSSLELIPSAEYSLSI